MAYTLGVLYHLPHGLLNAIILPLVLREYGNSIHNQLSEICDVLNLCDISKDKSYKAEYVILWIESMNKAMQIQKNIPEIDSKDLKILVDRAYNEANPLRIYKK